MSSQHHANSDRQAAKVMNRSDLTRRLVAKLKNHEAVIGGIGNTNFDLWASGQRPENFYMLGSMGLTIPIGLGVALAQPDRKVFVLEGDGSLLMQLGALGTVAKVAPKNLTVVIFDNAMFQITGRQQTLTAHQTDLVAISRHSGLANSVWAANESDFEALIDQSLASDGPRLIGTRIDDQKAAGTTDRDPSKIRIRFMQAMGATT
jgi:thiamine pyrophosphate-dependent acetolactate synthase large subunit-like protein